MLAKENKRKSVLEFLKGNRQFLVPNFQRRYSWNERNWGKIYCDIKNTSKTNSKHHFLGVIVYDKKHDLQSREYEELELVDGQQRITTIFLFLCALRKLGLINQKKFENFCFKNANRSQPGLILTKLDNPQFEFILKEHEVQNSSEEHPIIECYNHFVDKIQSSREIDFIKGLKRLWVVDIGLDSEKDDPHKVFESLNTAGKELEIYDTIRNFLLMKLKSSRRSEMYEKFWLPMENKYGKNIDNLRNFMFSFIGLKTKYTFGVKSRKEPYFKFTEWFEKELERLKSYESQYEINDSFNESRLEYIEWNKSNNESPPREEYLFNLVITYADYYFELAIKPEQNPSPKLRIPLCRLKSVDKKFNSPYSFLLGAYHKYKRNKCQNFTKDSLVVNEEDFIELIKIIESHYVRLQVCGVHVGKYLPELYAKMHNEINEDSYPYVESFKRTLSDKNRKYTFPSDDLFKKKFTQNQIEKASVQRFIIKCIELEKRIESEETDENRIEFINFSLTREHIMPVSLRRGKEILEWIEELGGENKWREVKDNWMNCIGNITIAPWGSNSKMSNKPFTDKKKIYFKKSRYLINKYFESIEDWNQEKIQNRANHLFEIAMKIWPYYGL